MNQFNFVRTSVIVILIQYLEGDEQLYDELVMYFQLKIISENPNYSNLITL